MKALNHVSRYFFIIFSLTILSCKKEVNQVIPNDFKPYVNSFFAEANARGIDIKLEDQNLEFALADLSERRIGECDRQRNRSLIRIDEATWPFLADCERRALVYHELGHCVLNRDHLNESNDRGNCQSIMRDATVSPCSRDLISAKWWSYYVNELFDSNEQENTFNAVNTLSLPMPEIVTSESINLVNSTIYELSPIPTASQKNFQLKLSQIDFDDSEKVGLTININNISLQYCDCTGVPLQIRRNTSGTECSVFFSPEKQMAELKSISVEVTPQEVHFFVNDTFFHSIQNIDDLVLDDSFLLTVSTRDKLSTELLVLAD